MLTPTVDRSAKSITSPPIAAAIQAPISRTRRNGTAPANANSPIAPAANNTTRPA